MTRTHHRGWCAHRGSRGAHGNARVIALLPTLVLFAAGLIGCTGQSPSTEEGLSSRTSADSQPSAAAADHNPQAASPTDAPGAAAEVPLTPIGAPATAHEESTGWVTEDLHNLVQARLNYIGELLLDRERIAPERLASLVDDQFAVTDLRPRELVAVLDDAGVRVLRSAEPDRAELGSTPSDQAGDQLSAAGLCGALRELASPLATGGGGYVKFKTYRVDLDGDSLNTTCYYLLSGRGVDGGLQQNAVWRCQWRVGPTADSLRLVRIDVSDYEEVETRTASGKMFADCTEAVLGDDAAYRDQLRYGIDYWRVRTQRQLRIDIQGYQGIAIADVNGDSLEDIYVCQGHGLPNRLFVQNADGTATDVSRAAGVDWLDRVRSALLIDLDNDSDPDLVVSMHHRLLLMANDGRGHFSLKAEIESVARHASLTSADYDNDGDLDIFVCGYGYLDFDDPQAYRIAAVPNPYHNANNGVPNILLRNDGQWSFTDVTGQTGLNENNRRFSWAASWEDYDNDGDVDLYVANDFGRNNLYRNDEGRFVDVAAEAGVEDIAAGMSVTWGDYNNDGLMDLYVSNMFSSAGGRIAYQRRFQARVKESVRQSLQRTARGNTLFENRGDGTFVDVSQAAAVTMGRWAWGSKFADLNNDGREDLLVANGYYTGETKADL